MTKIYNNLYIKRWFSTTNHKYNKNIYEDEEDIYENDINYQKYIEEREKEMFERDLKNLKYTYENDINYQKHIEEKEKELFIKREKIENERPEKSGLITRYKNRHAKYDNDKK